MVAQDPARLSEQLVA